MQARRGSRGEIRLTEISWIGSGKMLYAAKLLVTPAGYTPDIGYKGYRMQIDFPQDLTTAGDLFSTLKRLCGGAAGCASYNLPLSKSNS
jgi:hypothetical protein